MSNATNNTIREQKSLNDIVLSFMDAFKKFWVFTVILTIVVGIAGYLFYKHTYAPEYSSEATISITADQYNSNDRSQTNNTQLAEDLSVSFNYLINNEVFYEVIKKDMKLSYLPGTIEVTTIEGTNIISIKVTGSDADLVFKQLKSVMENYSSVAEFVIGDTKLTVLQEPAKANAPNNPYSPFKFVVAAMFLGFLLGCIPALVVLLLIKTIKNEEDVHKYLSMKCMGNLPAVFLGGKKNEKKQYCSVLNKNVGFRYIETMRSITARCEREFKKRFTRVILVTSTRSGEGKTTFAMNLAYSLSKNGRKVMLIDCDLRKPSLRKQTETEMKISFSMEEFLKGKYKSKDAVINLEGSKVLALLPDKPSENPLDSINSKDMEKFIEEAKHVVDYVIIDSPPSKELSDATVLAKYSDGIMYVIREDGVRVNTIINSLQSFNYTKKPIIGCVINSAPGVGAFKKYGYGGYYQYGNYGYGRRRYGYGYGQYGSYGYGYGEKKSKGGYGEVSDKEFRADNHATVKHIKLSTTEEEKEVLAKEKIEEKELEAKLQKEAEEKANAKETPIDKVKSIIKKSEKDSDKKDEKNSNND